MALYGTTSILGSWNSHFLVLNDGGGPGAVDPGPLRDPHRWGPGCHAALRPDPAAVAATYGALGLGWRWKITMFQWENSLMWV